MLVDQMSQEMGKIVLTMSEEQAISIRRIITPAGTLLVLNI